MEIFNDHALTHTAPRAVLFDFDGTLSTLRHGWEDVMLSIMLQELTDYSGDREELKRTLESYIRASTGIQTYFQMEWFSKFVSEETGQDARDPWDYKDIYNQALLAMVNRRIHQLESGESKPEAHLVPGSAELLDSLQQTGVELYVASGTDEVDVRHEAELLTLDTYFAQIAGAPHRDVSCAKEKVLKGIMDRFRPEELVVIGDGPVEIELGAAMQCRTIGVASNEKTRTGINQAKQERLIEAGADLIIGDYTDLATIMDSLNIPMTDKEDN